MSEADSTKAAYDEKKVSRRYQPEAETSSDDTDSSSSSSSSSPSSPCCSSSASSSSSSDSSSCGAGANSNSENDDYEDCQHETKEFLIQETNFDRGQLKLKISAKRKSVRKRAVLCPPPSASAPLDTDTCSPPSTSSYITNTTSTTGTTSSTRTPLDVTDQRPSLKITIKQPHQSLKNLPEITKEQKQLNAGKTNSSIPVSVPQKPLPSPPLQQQQQQHPLPHQQHQHPPVNQQHFKDVGANSSNLVHAVPFTSCQQKVSRIKQKNRNRIASQYDNRISSESVNRQSFEKHWPPVQLGKNFPTSAGKCSSYDSADCVRSKNTTVSSVRLKDSEILNECGGECIESTEDAASETGGLDYQAFSKYEHQNEINLNFISPKDPKKSNGAASTGQIPNESASDILNRSDVSPDSGIQSFPGTPVRNDSPSHTLLPSSDHNQVESGQIPSGNQINQCISAVAGPSTSSQQASATTSITNTFTTKPTSTITTTASQVTLSSISCDLNRQICDTRTASSASDSKHMGRRRGRGRPPKRAKNSWILQNKKSLIYARLYGEATDVIERTPFSNITLPERVQTNNHSEVNEYPFCQPVVPHKIVDKTFQSDAVNKPLSNFQSPKPQHEESCISPTRENKQTIPDHCLPIKKVKKSKISSVEPSLQNSKLSLFDDGKETNLCCSPKVSSVVRTSSDNCSKVYDNVSCFERTDIYPNGKQHANMYAKYGGTVANPTKAANFPASLGRECCQKTVDLFEFKDTPDDLPCLKRSNEIPLTTKGNDLINSAGTTDVSYFKSTVNAQLISNLSHARKQDCLPCYRTANEQLWRQTLDGQLTHQRLIDLSTSKFPNDFSVHRFDPFLNMVPKAKVDIAASKTPISLTGSKKADAACQSFSKKKNSITSDDIPSLQKADFDGLKSMKDASIPNRLGDTLPSRMYEDSPPILMRAEDLPCSEKVKDPPRLEEYGAPQAIKRAESRRKKAENLSKFKKAERQFVTLREDDSPRPRIDNLAARKTENEKALDEAKLSKPDKNTSSSNEMTKNSVSNPEELDRHQSQKVSIEVPEESAKNKSGKNVTSKKNSQNQKPENITSFASTPNNDTCSVGPKVNLQQSSAKKQEDSSASQKVDANNLLPNSENAFVPSRVQTPPILSKNDDHVPSKQQKQPPPSQQQKQSSPSQQQKQSATHQEKKQLSSSQQQKTTHSQKQSPVLQQQYHHEPPQLQQQLKAPPQLQQQKQTLQLKQQKQGNQQKQKQNSQQKPPPLERHPPQLTPQISPPPPPLKLLQQTGSSKLPEPSHNFKEPPQLQQSLLVPQLQQESQASPHQSETQHPVKAKKDEDGLVLKKLSVVERVKNLSKKAANNSQFHQENSITNQQPTKKKGVTGTSKKFGVAPGTKCSDKLSKVSVEQPEVEKPEKLPPSENNNIEHAKGKTAWAISVSKKNKESVLDPVPSITEEPQSISVRHNDVANDTRGSLPDPVQQVPRPKKAKKHPKLQKEIPSNKQNMSDDLVKLAEECFLNAKAAQLVSPSKNTDSVPKPKIKRSGIVKPKKAGVRSSGTNLFESHHPTTATEPSTTNTTDIPKSVQPDADSHPTVKNNNESKTSEVNNLVNGNNVRRKPGRPKGSKNKTLLTKAIASDKSAGTLHCQPDKNFMQNGISNNRSSTSKMGRKSTRGQLCSPKHRLSTPVKRPRGRPRKNLTDNALQALENKRSRHLEEGNQNGMEPETTTEVTESKRRAGFGQKIPLEEGDFDSLIRSVHDSIKSQFHGQDETEDFNDFNFSDNLDTIEPTLVNVCMQQEPKPTRVAPKIRRPKLHVMMRRPRRGRRKKKNLQAAGSQSFLRNSFSSNVNMPSKASFASFTSNNIHLNQPCFTTEGNTFSMFTATPISDKEQAASKTGFHSQSFKKFTRQYTSRKLINKKKKKRMLYFRSKHKNIVDPVFLADLDIIIGQFDSLIISESLDQIRRFNIGDKPMPSIFRLAKIINRKKKKERQVPCIPNQISSNYPHEEPSYQFPPQLSTTPNPQMPFHQVSEKPKKVKLRKEVKEKIRRESGDRFRKELTEKVYKEHVSTTAHREPISKNRKEFHEKVRKDCRDIESVHKGSSLDRTHKVSSAEKGQKASSLDRGRKGSLDRRRKDVPDKPAKDLTLNCTSNINTKYHCSDDGAKLCSDEIGNDQIPQESVKGTEIDQVSKVPEKPSSKVPEKLPSSKVPEKLPSAKVSEKLPSAKVSERLPSAKVSEKLLSAKVSEKLPSAKVSEKLPSAKVSEKLPSAKVSEKLPSAKVSEKLPSAKLSEKLPSAKVSEKLPSAKVSEKLLSAKVPEKLPSAKVPEKLPSAKVPEKLPSAKVPEKLAKVPEKPPSAKVPEKLAKVPEKPPSAKVPEKLPSAKVPEKLAKVPEKPLSAKVPEKPPSAKVPEKPPSAKVPEKPPSAKVPEKPPSAKVSEKPSSAKVPEKPSAAKVPEKPSVAKVPEKPSAAKSHRKSLSQGKLDKSLDKAHEKISDSIQNDKTVQKSTEVAEVVKELENSRKDNGINKDLCETLGKESAGGYIQEKAHKESVDKPRKESLERVRRDAVEKTRKESGEKVHKEKSKIVRRKSASEENLCQSSEELKMCNQQYLPPKKRHKLFSSVQSSAGMNCGLSSGKPDLVHQCTKTPEKRKVGRPRKKPLPFDDLLCAASGLEREQQSSEVESSSPVTSYSVSSEKETIPTLNEEPLANGSPSTSQASVALPVATPNRPKCSRRQSAAISAAAMDDTNNKWSNNAVLAATSPNTNCTGEKSALQISKDSELETDSSVVISSETPCPATQTEKGYTDNSINCNKSVAPEGNVDGSLQCSSELNNSKSQEAATPDTVKDNDSCLECHTLQTQVSNTKTGRGRPKLSSPEHSPDSKNAVEKMKRKLVNKSVQRLHKAGQARTKADRLLCSETSQRSQAESAIIDDTSEVTVGGQQTRSAVIYKRNSEKCNTDSDGRTSIDTCNESVIESVQSENEPRSTMHRKRKRNTTGDISCTKPKRRRQDCITSALKRSHDGFDDCHSDIPSQLHKKKYQKVGIYYEYYRNHELSRRSGLKGRDKTSQQNGNVESGLPVPLQDGKDLRADISDFQLPYDIWWMYKNNQLVRKDDHLNYRKVRNNFYVDIKPVSPYEPHPCSCSSGLTDEKSGCGEECLNRMIYTECSPGLCPCGDSCMNNRFQKHLWAPCLEMFLTPDRGYGVRSSHHLMLGQFILEYLGEVVSENEFRRRMTENYSQERHHYCLNLDGGAMIDGYRMGNIGRFVNHSCDPNCEMQKWNVNGFYRMGLFALKDIHPLTEITYDYNFHAYNIDSQQICRCGSEKCRGVIGGRTQRLNGMNKEKSGITRPVGRPPKDKRKSKSRLKKDKSKNSQDPTSSTSFKVPSQSVIKPMSNRERGFAHKHRIFLVRNIDKIREIRQKGQRLENEKEKDCDFIRDTNLSSTDMFLTKFTALKTERSVKTRRLAMADENSELTKMAKLAQVCREIMCAVREYKGEDGSFLAAQLFILPSKKKNPEYYEIVEDPIDINSIDSNINTGQYKSMEYFENDILKLFRNSEKYFKRKTEKGKQVQCLRKVYNTTRSGILPKLQEIMGTNIVNNSQNETESTELVEMRHRKRKEGEGEEEIIRCICNIYRDEGLMIQCEKCFIWQHCDCMGVKGNVANYLCEQCDPRYYPKEILMVPQPTDATPRNTYYMTLMRDDMQVHVGDCVYVMRDNLLKRSSDGTPVRTSYRLLSNISPDKLDIFRVERLWKSEKDEKFAYGHHYVRPHETFHEPYRKFFANEVFRIPLYDIIPLEAIIGTCCVLDLNTFCKGRPKGVKEQDVYICESRVDKSAHHFSKISRTRYPVLTKTYCFDKFEKRLVPKRTYSPHEVPETYKRRWPGERHPHGNEEGANNKQTTKKTSESNKSAAVAAATTSVDGSTAPTNGYAGEQQKSDVKTTGKIRLAGSDSEEDLPLVHVKQQKKKERLDKILQKLLGNIPGKQKVDVTYLLEEGAGKRPRKKPQFNF